MPADPEVRAVARALFEHDDQRRTLGAPRDWDTLLPSARAPWLTEADRFVAAMRAYEHGSTLGALQRLADDMARAAAAPAGSARPPVQPLPPAPTLAQFGSLDTPVLLRSSLTARTTQGGALDSIVEVWERDWSAPGSVSDPRLIASMRYSTADSGRIDGADRAALAVGYHRQGRWRTAGDDLIAAAKRDPGWAP